MTRKPERIRRSVRLGLFLRPHGHHLAAWRSPDVPAEGAHDIAYLRRVARLAEAGRFDFLFLADSLGVRATRQPDDALRRTSHVAHLEPVTLLAALSGATEHIGLVATASTTYWEPFHIARLFASLDHLSGGRAAWNIVTSNGIGETENFRSDGHPDHAARYARAREAVAVVRRLWDSFEDDAFVWDKAAGIALDLAKVHPADHHGAHFSVRGPLNIARPPQGHPVLVQAGGSAEGRDLAAATADVIFSVQVDRAEAEAFRTEIRTRAAAHGRDPDHVLVMPGLCPVIGASRAEAQERHAELQEKLHPALGLSMVSNLFGGADLSHLPLDGPVPALEETNASRQRLHVLSGLAGRDGLTLGGLARAIAGNRGHLQVFGTAADVADVIEDWIDGGAADGFNVMPAAMPGDFERFVAEVVPQLQRRGRFRTEYATATLRGNLGLPRPEHGARGAALRHG